MKSDKIFFSVIFLLTIISFALIFKNIQLTNIHKKTIKKYEDEISKLINEKPKKSNVIKYNSNNKNIDTKIIVFYSKKYFKTEFIKNNSSLIFDEFIDPMTWENLKYSISDSEDISMFLKKNEMETKKIISEMIDFNKELKLILIPKEDYLSVNFDLDNKKIASKSKYGTTKSNNTKVKKMNFYLDYDKKNITLQYSLGKNKIAKSSLEDEVNDRYLYGDEIQNLIENKILNLNFLDTKDFAIEETLEVLNLSKNYTSLNINIEYTNGEIFDYHLKNK